MVNEKMVYVPCVEFEEMKEELRLNKMAVEELRKDSKVILVDYRSRGYYGGYAFQNIPTIIADEKLAKEYLQKEFNDLWEAFRQTELELSTCKKELSECKNRKVNKGLFNFWK